MPRPGGSVSKNRSRSELLEIAAKANKLKAEYPEITLKNLGIRFDIDPQFLWKLMKQAKEGTNELERVPGRSG